MCSAARSTTLAEKPASVNTHSHLSEYPAYGSIMKVKTALIAAAANCLI
jgi:hypothetical protein